MDLWILSCIESDFVVELAIGASDGEIRCSIEIIDILAGNLTNII